MCVSAPAPWFLGERGVRAAEGSGEILGLLVARVGERGPGQRRARGPSPRVPDASPRPGPGRLAVYSAAGWSWAWRSGGALVRCAPAPFSLTLGPGRAVGARGRSGRCLRRSWRNRRPCMPLPVLRPETVEAEGCPARRVALSAPSCLRRGCRVPGTQPAAGGLCPPGAQGLCDRGLSPRLRARAQEEATGAAGFAAAGGFRRRKRDTAQAPLPPELKARKRPPKGRGGAWAVRPCSSCPATGLGRKPQEPGSEHSGTREKNCLAFKKTRVYWNRTH